MICAFFLQTDLFCGGRQSLHLISTRYAVMGFVLQGKTILKGAGTWWIHFSVRFIIGGSLSTSRPLVYKPGEHGISRGSFRNEEECSSPSHSWLWALLGINKKVKCFPMLCFPVTVMCTRPIPSTFTQPPRPAIFVCRSCSLWDPGLILCWMEPGLFPLLVPMLPLN